MGKAMGKVQGNSVRVEMKSVNHRFCEVHFRAHGKYNILDIPTQNLVKSIITRGRVDIFVAEDKTVELSPVESQAFQSYFDYLKNIKESLDIKEEIGLQHLLSGVNNWVQKEMDPDKSWKEFQGILKAALQDLNDMRVSEGKRLKESINKRVESIQKIIANINKYSESVKAELQDKLGQKISERVENLKDLDPQRLEMEVIYYLDRMDISEELERLESHMVQMQKFQDEKKPIGRKIDFLLQEFNREFNTIASKSQSADVAHLVVEAKSELEKIREQIQNIE